MRPSRRRLYVLVAILLSLVVTVILNRDYVSSIPNARARGYLAEHQWDKTHKWLKVSQWIAPSNPETQLLFARLFRQQDRIEEAQASLNRALRLGASQEVTEREARLLLAQSGQVGASLSSLPELLDTQWTELPEVYEAFALGVIKSRTQLEAAYQLLAQWAQEFPDSPRPHYLLAQLSIELEDAARGETSLRRALEIDPQYAPAALALGELLTAAKRPDEALQFFQIAARGDLEREPALIGQVRCLRRLGARNAARDLVRQILADDPNSMLAILELAKLELDAGEYSEAIKHLRQVVDRAPKNHDARLTLARALRSAGNEQQAERHFKIAHHGRAQLSRARQLTMQLLTDVNNTELRRTIGDIYLEAGPDQEGITWLQSALQLNPHDQRTLESLADYYDYRKDQQSREMASRYRELLN